MLVMGLPHGFRLIMPKVLALAIAMPLLVVWTDAMALFGGMMAASLELGLSPRYFVQELPDAVPIANYWIGLGKGVAFGSLIALVACHFGLRIEPNTESLGQGTTTAVVTAITAVILAAAVFAIVCSGVGVYRWKRDMASLSCGSRACAPGSGISWCTTTWTWKWRKAISWPWWAAPVPAKPPCCARSWGWSGQPPAACACSGKTSTPSTASA